MITFTRHVFATLTYQRDCEIEQVYRAVSLDYNRFLQRLRRLHRLQIEYLRVIEEHRDGYPHIHALLQYPSACIRVENTRYFDRMLYQRWKTLWRKGHSDYQKPRQNSIGTLSYIMKYLIKNQTQKTVWKKVFAHSVDVKSSASTNSFRHIAKTTGAPVRLNGIKLCSWSRKFDFSPFVMSSKQATGGGGSAQLNR